MNNFYEAEVGWEAAWLSEEASDFDDLEDAADEAQEAEKSQPIYRTPAFPDSLLDAAEAEAQTYHQGAHHVEAAFRQVPPRRDRWSG